MSEPNPFRPGAGRVPPVLAGRDAIMSVVDSVMRDIVGSGEGDRPIVVSGLRGVGKTVLLNEFVRRARESRRWVAIKLEAVNGRSLASQLAQALHTEMRKQMSLGDVAVAKLRRAASALRSFQLKVDPTGTYSFGFDVQPLAGVADSGQLEVDLRELLEELAAALRELDTALLLAIDELQEAPAADLNALNVALHDIGQDAHPAPILFIGTGLPSLPAVLADATSYAERLYDYRALDLLTDSETRVALSAPTGDRGVSWDVAALDEAVASVSGYPYFAQACGKHVWASRAVADRISAEDARIGIELARDEVDRGLYQSRWERATPAQREVMKAMALDAGRPSSMQDLVARTGKKRTSDLSVSRRELIRNGHVYAPDRGYLSFTVPGMDDYIERRGFDI